MAGGTDEHTAPSSISSSAAPPITTTARLTYFRGWGLAEQTRWVMAAAGIGWEQVGLESHEQFVALKDGGRLLFNQLPLLEIDGLELVQSQAMLRYVAGRGGLRGATPAEEALADMVAEAVKDARGPVVAYPFGDPADVASRLPPTVAKLFPRFERVLSDGEGGGVLPSGGLCYADVLLAELVDSFVSIAGGPDLLAPFPLLAALHCRILAMPRIQEYLSSDRRYPFPAAGSVAKAYAANVGAVLGW